MRDNTSRFQLPTNDCFIHFVSNTILLSCQRYRELNPVRAAMVGDGVDNQLLEPVNIVAFSTEPVQRRERLGGMLNFYHR
jgi:hypothetical protein